MSLLGKTISHDKTLEKIRRMRGWARFKKPWTPNSNTLLPEILAVAAMAGEEEKVLRA